MVTAPKVERVIRDELNRYPGVDYEFGQGKHSRPHVLIRFLNPQTKKPDASKISYSVAGHQDEKAVLQQIRRLFRTVGIEPRGESPFKDLRNIPLVTSSQPNPPARILPDMSKQQQQQQQEEPKPMETTTTMNGEVKSDKKTQLTTQEIWTASKLIEENRIIVRDAPEAADRVIKYKPDWSDKRVADILRKVPGRAHITDSGITRLRKELFGKLESEVKQRKKGTWSTRVEARLAALERDVADLKAANELLRGERR